MFLFFWKVWCHSGGLPIIETATFFYSHFKKFDKYVGLLHIPGITKMHAFPMKNLKNSENNKHIPAIHADREEKPLMKEDLESCNKVQAK